MGLLLGFRAAAVAETGQSGRAQATIKTRGNCVSRTTARLTRMAKEEFRYIVRVANTDLDGKKQIRYALRKIKGVGVMIANAVLAVTGIPSTIKAGEMSDEQIAQLNEVLSDPAKHSIPSWLFNRRKDYETGEDKHLLGGDLKFTIQSDIKRLQKIKSYRGMRHAYGLPVRGQRTKSNFRKNKGKTSLGVQRKKAQGGKK